jgi:hypothetical protein
MKTTCIVVLSVFYALVGPGMLPDPPPLRLYLEHGNERVDVRIDEPFELTVGGEKVSLTLRARPTRILDIGSGSSSRPALGCFAVFHDCGIHGAPGQAWWRHIWSKSQKGSWIIKRKTAKDRLARTIGISTSIARVRFADGRKWGAHAPRWIMLRQSESHQ